MRCGVLVTKPTVLTLPMVSGLPNPPARREARCTICTISIERACQNPFAVMIYPVIDRNCGHAEGAKKGAPDFAVPTAHPTATVS